MELEEEGARCEERDERWAGGSFAHTCTYIHIYIYIYIYVYMCVCMCVYVCV